LINTTAKSGIAAFAPDFEHVMSYKEGRLSEQSYTELYEDKMVESRDMHRAVWDRLSVYPYSAYACYCPAGQFCHRHLFIQHAKSHLESMGWRVRIMGEITKEHFPKP
jgi:hypothetical protein